jgi:4a-hydroxytetrahydrobiopterin dehydratase
VTTAAALSDRHCKPCAKGTPPLDRPEAERLRAGLHGDWALSTDGREISRTFSFANFYQTMAFVNALAWVAHSEDHHPDFEVGYKRCHVRYSTHMIGGLSENDFICAARIDALLPAAD